MYDVVLWWFLLADDASKSASPTREPVYHYVRVESKPTQPAYQTVEPDSAHKEKQPQYEVPVLQKHNVYKSNEVGKMKTV